MPGTIRSTTFSRAPLSSKAARRAYIAFALKLPSVATVVLGHGCEQ